MLAFLKTWIGLRNDRRAVTALEYGLIAALIAGVIVTAVTQLGGSVKDTFNTIKGSMDNGNTAAIAGQK